MGLSIDQDKRTQFVAWTRLSVWTISASGCNLSTLWITGKVLVSYNVESIEQG